VFGALSIPEASPREIMQSLAMELPNTADPKALSKLALQAQYRLTENALQLSKLDLTLDDTRIRGAAGIDDLEKVALRFDLAVDRIDVDRYLAPEPQASARSADGGAAPAEAEQPKEPTELPIDALRELNARGELRIARAKLEGLEFTNVRLPLDARGGLVRLGPTSAELFGGKYAGNTVLDARPSRARLSMDERMSGVDIGAVMKASFDSTRLSGRADATAVLNGTGNTDVSILKTLSGNTTFDIKEGAVNGVDLWYELRRARALWKREAQPQRTGPARTAFNVFKGSAQLDAGVVKNDDLRIETDYLRASGRGTLNIDTQAIDYRVTAEVYEIPPEGAGAEMADLKALEIPMTITGTLAEPKVRPDLDALVKQRVKEKVEEKKEEVKKRITDKLRDLIGN
jgi:AsmA protein